MALLPAHRRLLEEEDTDEDLTDAQVQDLLEQASRRMREARTNAPSSAVAGSFKLPKLQPGHIADTYLKTEGAITRLDTSKLVDKEQQALANGVKKIEDPLLLKKQKEEVHLPRPPLLIAGDDIYPNFFLKQTLAPFWMPSCVAEGFLLS